MTRAIVRGLMEVMKMPAFVNFETPKELSEKTYDAVEKARDTGKLKKGVNEATKAIERGVAKLIIMAEDVDPEEVMMHLPVLCDEKKVPYSYVPSKSELGKAAGLEVPTSTIAITQEGDSKKFIDEIAKKTADLKK